MRIHVERAIGRIKTYRILDGNLPNTLSPYASQIDMVCGLLTNFLLPLLPLAKAKPKIPFVYAPKIIYWMFIILQTLDNQMGDKAANINFKKQDN